MAIRLKPGDVFILRTPKGDAYLQYTLKNPEYGQLLRVLPGLHVQPPASLTELVQDKEVFFVFFPLQAAVNRGLVRFVANHEVPLWAQGLPVMRRPGGRAPNGKPLNWILWDGTEEWRVDKLSEEEAEMSLAVIWNDTLLIERLCAGWLPANET